jgi:hypothetical protein
LSLFIAIDLWLLSRQFLFCFLAGKLEYYTQPNSSTTTNGKTEKITLKDSSTKKMNITNMTIHISQDGEPQQSTISHARHCKYNKSSIQIQTIIVEHPWHALT